MQRDVREGGDIWWSAYSVRLLSRSVFRQVYGALGKSHEAIAPQRTRTATQSSICNLNGVETRCSCGVEDCSGLEGGNERTRQEGAREL